MPPTPMPPAGKLNESARRAAAAAWLAGARWLLLTMRGGRAAESQGGVSRMTARVFARGCPAHCLRDVIQMLAESTPLKDPVADAAVMPGEWHHKAAWWQRDAQSQGGGDTTLTLFRELGDGPVTETGVVDDGCGSRTGIRYVWDAAAVEDLSGIPGSGAQGVQVRIAGVSRDPETFLFSYYVTTTTRLTQLLPPHLTSEDAFSADYDASWLGLYGTSSAPEDDSGGPVSVWDPAVRAIGEAVSVQWRRNSDDCTLDASGRLRVAKRDVADGASCVKTLFEERDGASVRGSANALGHAPEPSGGVVWRHESKLRPDGLWDNARDRTAERPVAGADVSAEEDLFSRTEVTVDRGQASQPPPASAAGGVIRRSRRSRTPGGLGDNTVTVIVEKPAPAARVSEASDVFGSATTTLDRHRASPAPAVAPGGGVSGSVSADATPGGLLDVSVTLKREATVPGARRSSQATLFQRKTSETVRSSPSGAPAASAGGGVGTSVSEALTPGGLRDVGVDTDEELFVGSASVGESVSVFERTLRSTDVHSRGARVPASAAGGVVVETSEERQPLGSRNLTTVTRRELPVPSASVAEASDAFRTSVRTRNANMPDPGPPPAQPAGTLLSRTREVTPGGLRTFTDDVSVFRHVPASGGRSSGDLDSKAETTVEASAPSKPAPSPGYVAPGLPLDTVDWRLTPAGTYDITRVRDTPGPFRSFFYYSYMSTSAGLVAVKHIHLFNARQEDVTDVIAAEAPGKRVATSLSLNRFGLLTGEVTLSPWIGSDAADNSYSAIEKTGLVEYNDTTATINGEPYAVRTTVTYNVKRDWGLNSGYGLYSGGLGGSQFRTLSGDWYEFRKVTKIEVSRTPLSGDVTKTVVFDRGGVTETGGA